jgi:hypothetical protein
VKYEFCTDEEFRQRVLAELNRRNAPDTIRIEWGLRLDCTKNGCEPPHSDDGRVFPHNQGMGTPTTRPKKAYPINSHATTIVTRTIVETPWVTKYE